MAWHNFVSPQAVFDRLKVGDQDRLSQLLQVPAGIDPLTDAGLQQAVDYANAEIESFVLARYSQPFAVIPPILAGYGVSLAIWRLKQRRRELISDEDRTDFEDTMRALREISDGTRQLIFPPENQTEALVPPTRVAVSSVTEGQREFRRNLESF